jgi:hypothetical protein
MLVSLNSHKNWVQALGSSWRGSKDFYFYFYFLLALASLKELSEINK